VQVLALGDGPGLLDRSIAAGAAAYLDVRTSACDDVVHALGLLARGERAVSAHMLSTVFQATRTTEHERLRPLSTRERQVLAWVSAGADNGDIAESLQITERTVKAHVSSLYRKLRQDNRTQLALLARQLGIRPPQRSGHPGRST
jgi:two-component system nitrate/nitrite response regulator NarL